MEHESLIARIVAAPRAFDPARADAVLAGLPGELTSGPIFHGCRHEQVPTR